MKGRLYWTLHKAVESTSFGRVFAQLDGDNDRFLSLPGSWCLEMVRAPRCPIVSPVCQHFLLFLFNFFLHFAAARWSSDLKAQQINETYANYTTIKHAEKHALKKLFPEHMLPGCDSHYRIWIHQSVFLTLGSNEGLRSGTLRVPLTPTVTHNSSLCVPCILKGQQCQWFPGFKVSIRQVYFGVKCFWLCSISLHLRVCIMG